MSENNKNETAYGEMPNFKVPSPREQAALNLRALMLSKEGDEKCILCKAAEELEKSLVEKCPGLDWTFPFLLMLAFSGWIDTSFISPETMKECLDDLEKAKGNTKEGNNA